MAGAIPGGAAEITPAWLTGVLRGYGSLKPDQRVERVELERLSGTDSLSCLVLRASLGYTTREPAGPETVVIKLPSADATERTNGFASSGGLYQREVRFYNDLGPWAGMPAPFAHLAVIDAQSERMTIVLEDLPNGHIGEDGTATGEELMAAVRALARMHGRWWDSSELDRYRWLAAERERSPTG